MPPRTGQLDEISQAIGRLEGSVDGIEKYIHDRRHDDKQVSMKIDGLATRGDISAVERRIDVQLKTLDQRLGVLEQQHQRDDGAKSIAVWFLQSPLIGWIAAGVLAFVALWKKP